jgi:hypothetical protein
MQDATLELIEQLAVQIVDYGEHLKPAITSLRIWTADKSFQKYNNKTAAAKAIGISRKRLDGLLSN